MNQQVGVPASKKSKLAHEESSNGAANGHHSNGHPANGANGNTNGEATPPLSSQACIELESDYSAHNYHPMPVVFSRAEGAHVWDPEGKQYIDCLSAYSAVNQVYLRTPTSIHIHTILTFLLTVSLSWSSGPLPSKNRKSTCRSSSEAHPCKSGFSQRQSRRVCEKGDGVVGVSEHYIQIKRCFISLEKIISLEAIHLVRDDSFRWR